ncbi:hypothetical protein PYW08_001355 [Mythimna loreyi]|uniref:Uncharacterized protein n=1 Tax=Mythimna loreyi TaxID=667449 RepID=A0ACC2R2J5_9NEOP|nr:hypothetical protein PYW08_001355 [Mythimna loreyi]
MPRAAPLSRAALLVLGALLHRSVLADQLCDTMHYGNETQFALNRGVLRVDPGMFTLEISEPHVCSNSEAVGLKVTACDEGHAPRVMLLDATHGVVVRAASPTHAAQVYVTMYCATDTGDADMDSPAEVQSYLGEASFQSSSVPTPVSTPDSLLLLEVEPSSSTNEHWAPVALESRFSSHLNGPPKPTSLLSRIKDLWQDHTVPLLGQFKSHLSPDGTSSNLVGNPTSSPTDTSSSSVAKRLIDLQPLQPPKMVGDRSPWWKQRPTRRPSSPWLQLRSLFDKKTRKSMSQSGTDPWTPYDGDDPLSLHWTEEPTDSNYEYTEGSPPAPYAKGYPKQNEGANPLSSRQSKSSIKHDSKKHTRYVPPIHEEDPALLLEWKNRLDSQAPLPKLLLLLQENPTPDQRTCEHSVEDTEPWWMNKQNKEIGEEGIPWEPDYLSDYTADDGDTWSDVTEPSTDDKTPHHANVPRAPQLQPSSGHQAPAPQKYLYYSPSPLTERPLLTPAVHHSLSWTKSSNGAPHKSPMMIKQPFSKKVLEPQEHTPSLGYGIAHDTAFAPYYPQPAYTHYPSNYYPSKPELPPGPAFVAEHILPSNSHYASEPTYPSEPSYASDSLTPAESYSSSEPDYPSEPYLSPEHQYPSKPHQSSKPRAPLKPRYPTNGHIASESHLPAQSHSPKKLPFPSKPSKPHHHSKPQHTPKNQHSSSPWNFLSELLLSHPTFRDSTHVIRIR